MSSLAPAIIVCERRPCWESQLKRRLPSAEILVRPCRAAADALALARAMPGSVLVVDLRIGTAPALRLLEHLSILRLRISPVIVTTTSTAEIEWPLRELGTVAFLPETISGNDLADLCRRLLDGSTSASREVTHAAGQGRADKRYENLPHSTSTSTNIGSPGSF